MLSTQCLHLVNKGMVGASEHSVSSFVYIGLITIKSRYCFQLTSRAAARLNLLQYDSRSLVKSVTFDLQWKYYVL